MRDFPEENLIEKLAIWMRHVDHGEENYEGLAASFMGSITSNLIKAIEELPLLSSYTGDVLDDAVSKSAVIELIKLEEGK